LMNRKSDMFDGRPRRFSAMPRSRCYDEPADTVANRIFIPTRIAMVDTDDREPQS
jgi:hypothetical protein